MPASKPPSNRKAREAYSKLRAKGVDHEKAFRLADAFAKIDYLKMRFPLKGTRELSKEDFGKILMQGIEDVKMSRVFFGYFRAPLLRILEEGSGGDLQTQRKVIDIIVHTALDNREKNRIDKIITKLGDMQDRTISNFLQRYHRGFDKKPEAVKSRLIQEARANLHGIIGAERVLRGLRMGIEESKESYKLFHEKWGPRPGRAAMDEFDEKNPQVISAKRYRDIALILERIFSNPKNVVYLQREIVHAWKKPLV